MKRLGQNKNDNKQEVQNIPNLSDALYRHFQKWNPEYLNNTAFEINPEGAAQNATSK